jgi:hypothetical protein
VTARKLTFKQAIADIESKFGLLGVYAVNRWIDIEPRIDLDLPDDKPAPKGRRR